MIRKKGDLLRITDAYLRPLHVGDTIKDSDGTLYTLDGFGRAEPLNGGHFRGFDMLLEPELVEQVKVPDPVRDAPAAYTPAAVASSDGQNPPAPARRVDLDAAVNPLAPPNPPKRKKEQPVQVIRQAKPKANPAPKDREATAPAPDAVPSKVHSGRTSKSGVAAFKNMRSLGRKGSELRAIAEAHDFELLVKHPHDLGIPIRDRDRFYALVASIPPGSVEPRKCRCGNRALVEAARAMVDVADQYLVCRTTRSIFVLQLDALRRAVQSR